MKKQLKKLCENYGCRFARYLALIDMVQVSEDGITWNEIRFVNGNTVIY